MVADSEQVRLHIVNCLRTYNVMVCDDNRAPYVLVL